MATNLATLSAELDFVDQAAVEVLQRNALNAYSRRMNERRDELNRVLRRVDHICDNFENYQTFNNKSSSVQYVAGLEELEKIVKDTNARKKYLDDVTIFVVGFEETCKNRVGIIEQVSEFLMDNENLFDSELKSDTEIDFDELSNSVEETIKSVADLNDKIGQLHRGVVDSVTAHYNAKGAQKQKRKLEKSLEEARKDLGDLSDKLVQLNKELQERDLKVQQLSRQLEAKASELQKQRAAGEVNRAAASKLAEAESQLQQRSDELDQIRQQMEQMRSELQQQLLADQQSAAVNEAERIRVETEANSLRQQLSDVTGQLRDAQAAILEMRESSDSQQEKAKMNLKRHLSAMRKKYETEIQKLKSPPDTEFDENRQTVFLSDDEEEQIQRRVTEDDDDIYEFEHSIEFDDENAWNSAPRNHLRGRFAAYRREATSRLTDLANQLQQQQQRAAAKNHRLQARFAEFKGQCDTERMAMSEALATAEAEVADARRKADAAVAKLEQFYLRVKETQNLSEASGNQLQSHAAQLQIDKAKLETQVEDLLHQVNVLNSKFIDASRKREEAEERMKKSLDAAAAAAAAPEPKSRSPTTQMQLELERSDLSEPDVPFPDEVSDSTIIRPGLHLADHPIVSEFMRTYQHIMHSKNRLNSMLTQSSKLHKQVATNLAAVDADSLDREQKITPQIEDLGRNLTFVSDQMFLLVENVLLQVENQQQQQPQQQQQQQQQLQQSLKMNEELKLKQDSLLKQMEELQAKYQLLANQLSAKEQELQQQQTDRDATVAELQQSVQSLTAEVERLRAEQQFELQNSLMFTRLDAERNTKTLKKALASRRIDSDVYESTVEAMEEYSTLPARRLQAMAQRLLRAAAAQRLRSIAGADRRLARRAADVERAASDRYSAIMDFLREQRLMVANSLIDTFHSVSEASSIFLIRPVLSLQYQKNLQQHMQTVADRNRRRAAERRNRLSACPEEEEAGLASQRLPQIDNPLLSRNSTAALLWSVDASADTNSLAQVVDRNSLNTPRLLEMDVNRILLGQNRVSASLDPSAEGGLRCYMPLKRRSLENFAAASSLHQQKLENKLETSRPPTTPPVARQNTQVPLPPIKAKTQS